MVAYFLSWLAVRASSEEMVYDQLQNEHLFSISMISPWFTNIENYLVVGRFPPILSSREKRNIVRKSSHFTWIGGNIFRLGPDQVLRRCIRDEEVFDILSACHDGPCGGLFSAKMTSFKVL